MRLQFFLVFDELNRLLLENLDVSFFNVLHKESVKAQGEYLVYLPVKGVSQ